MHTYKVDICACKGWIQFVVETKYIKSPKLIKITAKYIATAYIIAMLIIIRPIHWVATVGVYIAWMHFYAM